MAKRIWTDEQLQAIKSRSSDILVSAAAGSGKTAVLTERLIRKITDRDDPLDVSRMLVVTFTKDAASELKQRIRDALSSEMASDPSNKRIKRQYLLLPNAKITTIHGFCFDVIRQNCHSLGIAPSVKVSEEAQTSLLMKQVAELVIDNYYACLPGYDDIPDFVTFADNFITLQDSSLSEILISQYNKLSSFPDGVDFLLKSVDEYDLAQTDLFSSVWGKEIKKYAEREFSYFLKVFDDACSSFTDGGVFESKYLPSFDLDRQSCKYILSALNEEDYEKISSALSSVTKINLGGVPKDLQDNEVCFFKDERTAFHKKISDIKERFFSVTKEQISNSACESKKFVLSLHKFLTAFDKKYSYEKSKRGILDFADLERIAYKLLVSKSGEPTETAIELGKRFDQVCIDEYQDVNSLQDGIFKAIAKNTNRFMVGDIKQSIYAFRGAEPSIFASYRLDESIDLISLTNNFRSDLPVIEFSNEVCGNLFTKYGSTVPYDDSDKLRFKKGSNDNYPTEFNVILKEKATSDELIDAEARYTASRINDLISAGEKPSSIAILLRAASSNAQYFERALSEYGIRSKNNDELDLFVNPEVLLAMSILNVIDNPSRDIYLAGALKSPIYNFTLSELALIRRCGKNLSLFEALKKYTEENDFQKGKFFLKKLDEYRKLSNEPVDKLIWHILNDTGLFAITSSQNGSGKANLMMLYEHARTFEDGTFKGLYNFIRYINDIIDSGASLPSAKKNGDDEIVKIMSIHKSKGLEFENVFLCGTAKEFNRIDAKNKVIVDAKFGVTLKLSDSTGLGTVETVFRRASGLGITESSNDEEIRVLYVALTRAKKRLFISGAISSSQLVDNAKFYKRYVEAANGYVFSKNPSLLFWLTVAQDSVAPRVLNDNFTQHNNEVYENSGNLPITDDCALNEKNISSYYDEYKRRFEFSYPSEQAMRIPAKLSVSELYPSILDDYDDSLKLFETRKARIKDPRFIVKSSVSGADIGTATHQFMQFCDFKRLKENGVEAELQRLIDQRYLPASSKELVNVKAVKRFSEGELCSTLISCTEIKREIRFNVRLNASSFTSSNESNVLDNETILVQGIIDCLFTDKNGKLTVLDYKTDSISAELSENEAEQALIDRHLQQLSYYAAACKVMTGKEVDNVIIYSFALNRPIEIPKDRLIKL